MTKSYSWPTPVFVPMKPTGWNTGMLQIVDDDATGETILRDRGERKARGRILQEHHRCGPTLPAHERAS